MATTITLGELTISAVKEMAPVILECINEQDPVKMYFTQEARGNGLENYEAAFMLAEMIKDLPDVTAIAPQLTGPQIIPFVVCHKRFGNGVADIDIVPPSYDINAAKKQICDHVIDLEIDIPFFDARVFERVANNMLQLGAALNMIQARVIVALNEVTTIPESKYAEFINGATITPEEALKWGIYTHLL